MKVSICSAYNYTKYLAVVINQRMLSLVRHECSYKSDAPFKAFKIAFIYLVKLRLTLDINTTHTLYANTHIIIIQSMKYGFVFAYINSVTETSTPEYDLILI